VEKLEWLCYQMVKNFEDIFIRFGATHERGRQTDRRTPHADIYRAYAYASRGKNYDNILSSFHLIQERHGQTGRQRELLYQYRASVCWVLTRDKN